MALIRVFNLKNSEIRTRPYRKGQKWHFRSLCDGSSWQSEETHKNHATRAESRLGREVLLVSIVSIITSDRPFNETLFQRMSQLVGPHQSARLGRGQRSEEQTAPEVDPRIGRLPWTDDHRSAHIVRRDGRLVQFGEAYRQVGRVGRHPAPYFRGDQGRGESGALSCPVHLSA